MIRIACGSVEDFLDNLHEEHPNNIMRQTIWELVSSNPIDGNPRDAVKFAVNYQASCVISSGGMVTLMEVGENCGIDYRDSTQDLEGSKRANERSFLLRAFCDDRGLKVRLGVVESL